MKKSRKLILSALALILACTNFVHALRIRKSWDLYTPHEKDVYKKAVITSMKSGHHLLFTKMAMDVGGLPLVQNTGAEPIWYRKWLMGYENMLRSQGDEYRQLTLPYWNFFEDAAKRMSSRVHCNSIVECSSFLTDLGSCEGDPYLGRYTVNGVVVDGNCVNKSVAVAACTSRAKSGVCEHCIPRGDWNIEQSTYEFGPSAFAEVLRHAIASDTPMDTLRTSIATRFHYILHNMLGGVYETKAAAFDPIFIGHYSTIDMIYSIYQRCHPVSITSETVSSSSPSIPMILEGHAVEDHPVVGSFFDGVGSTILDMEDTRTINDGYDYELDAFLHNMFDIFAIECRSSSPEVLMFSQDRPLSADQEASHSFVEAIATCNDSTLTGTKGEAPFTAIVCQIMSKQQNGVFTNFSTTTRDAWNVPTLWLPTCVPVLEGISNGSIQVQITDACHQSLMNETSISTNDFTTKKYGVAIVTRGKDGFVTRVHGSLG